MAKRCTKVNNGRLPFWVAGVQVMLFTAVVGQRSRKSRKSRSSATQCRLAQQYWQQTFVQLLTVGATGFSSQRGKPAWPLQNEQFCSFRHSSCRLDSSRSIADLLNVTESARSREVRPNRTAWTLHLTSHERFSADAASDG